jgi:L-malate glycosyltransferase
MGTLVVNFMNLSVIPAEFATTSLRRTKLLLVENSLHVTGAFKSALAIVEALRPNYDIEMVLPATSTLKSVVEAKGLVCHQLPMVQLGRSWKKLLRYLPHLFITTFLLRRLLVARRIDLLLINDYYNLLGATIKVTGWSGKILTLVRLMPMNQQKVLNRVWTALAIRFSDRVVAVSWAVRRQLPKNEKIEVIYDPSSFIEKYPATLPVDETNGTVRCLYLANYIAGKGHIYALEAFIRAYAVNPKLRLRFVGGDMGLDKNAALKQTLQQRVETLRLNEVISFHSFSEDVEKEIKISTIVLNFSESESFSNTCLEACAFSRPIIATRCGGPEEIVDDGVSGLLVPVRDVDAMTQALIGLSRNEPLQLSMGKAGQLIVNKRFSEQAYVLAFEKLGFGFGYRSGC